MLSIIKTLQLMTLKIINKYINCFLIFLVASIACHLTLIFFLNFNNFIDIKKNNNNCVENIPYMHANMIDFNPKSIIADDNNKKKYKTPISEKNKKHSTETFINNQSQIKKNENFNSKNIQKSLLNNTIKKTDSPKKSIKVNDLISKLTENEHIHKNFKISKNNNNDLLKNNTNDIHYNEIENFKDQIHQAIKDKFYNYSSYIGQNCDVNIQTGLDGKLISLVSIKGDTGLCQAAISAIELAKLPKPPNNYIYDMFKNITLKFSPK